MSTHLRRHHLSVSIAGTRRKQGETSKLQTIPAAFRQAFPTDSNKAKQITEAIGTFIDADMRPYYVVENAGFKNMLHVIEPCYTIPSRGCNSCFVLKNKSPNRESISRGTCDCSDNGRLDV